MKRIIAVLVAVLMLIPAGFAYAAPAKKGVQEFKASVKEKLVAIKKVRTENQELKKEIKQNTQKLRELIKDMKENKKSFEEDKAKDIQERLEDVKKDMESLKNLNSYKDVLDQFKINQKKSSFSEALTGLDRVLQIQTSRNIALKGLNAKLQELISEMNKTAISK